MNLDAALREMIHKEVQAAVTDALADVDLSAPASEPDETWRSRLWSVAPETRLTLGEAAEALGVSERSVRRYIDGNGDRPVLPGTRGPTGLTIRAGDLRTWIQDTEQANRFRRRAASR